MKRIFGLSAFLMLSLAAAGQNYSQKKLFSDAEKQIVNYQEKVNKAYEDGKGELGEIYRDSVKLAIIGSYLGNHSFKTLEGKIIDTKALAKPLFILASATYCGPCVAEIPALNRIAREYGDKVTFMVLFADTLGKELSRLSKRYTAPVAVVPSLKETENIYSISISGFQHILGFPTNYLVTRSQQIVGYSQGASAPGTYPTADGKELVITQEQADAINYKKLKAEVELLLASQEN
ncbi:hypothetical protein [Nibribacter koreensis]|uniref:Thioredoxin domain-containing protein n=1 Tax=Nibribacter koreensis TaxID=1084519 RepID=A0ABP8F738_9BACT